MLLFLLALVFSCALPFNALKLNISGWLDAVCVVYFFFFHFAPVALEDLRPALVSLVIFSRLLFSENVLKIAAESDAL